MGIAREVSVGWRKKSEVGSCNGCTAQDYHMVYEVHLRSVTVRLCADCMAIFKHQIRSQHGR